MPDLPLIYATSRSTQASLPAMWAYEAGLTQPQVDAWRATLPGAGFTGWIAANPILAFGIGAAALLLLLPRRGRR